jgi:hypothetical protein
LIRSGIGEAAVPQKAFRDPIHRHIYFDKERDQLILDLISCPEVQRLRRIRQLGVSSITYHGAEHSRFGHALGACHLMGMALRTVEQNDLGVNVDENTRLAALAAALLHDIGHGPFSHVLEGELFPTKSHELRTKEIIRDETSAVNQTLRKHDPSLPETVAKLIEGRPREVSWLSCLIHSQLDVDRMDYLLRDSHYCGVGYGQYDAERILHTMRIREVPPENVMQPVWLEKGGTAVEEYIFARYYMYWNVYYHRTTRGYEELLKAIFRRASEAARNNAGKLGDCPERMKRAILGEKVELEGFLALDDSVVVAQLIRWRDGGTPDEVLSDLSRRFLDRDGLKPVEPRGVTITQFGLLNRAREVVEQSGRSPEYYFLTNKAVTSAYDCYHPEEEADESSAGTSILIELEATPKGGRPFREISRVSERLKRVTGSREVREFCYVPQDCRDAVKSILAAG